MSSKNICRSFAVGAAMMLAAWGATALASSTLPLSDDFESGTYSVGQDIAEVGSKGWQANSNTYAIVTNLGYTFTASSLPLTNVTHEQVVMLNTEGSFVSNVFDYTEANTNVFIDMMYKIVLSDTTPDSVTNQSDVQAAFYFDTNRNLVVFHSKYYGDVEGVPVYSNQIWTVTNAFVSTDSWTRITVAMDYLTDTANDVRYFKIALDGQAYDDPEGYSQPLRSSPQPGPWFLCANKELAPNKGLTSIAMSGTGLFDDFVVTTEPPAYGAGQVIVTANVSPADGRGGDIQPRGPIFLAPGSSTNFTITVSNAWDLVMIKTNGNDSGVVTYDFALTDIVQNVQVTAVFQPERDVNSVPLYMYARWGFDTNALPGDDGDGIPYDQEYWASTDPTDSNSYFHVQSIGKVDGTNYIEWVTRYVDPELGPFGIQKATNMVEGYFNADPPMAPRLEGTNRWWEGAPALIGVPEFFRVNYTNTP